VQAASWAAAEPAVLVVDYAEEASEGVSREIELSRWGSRRFFHWLCFAKTPSDGN